MAEFTLTVQDDLGNNLNQRFEYKVLDTSDKGFQACSASSPATFQTGNLSGALRIWVTAHGYQEETVSPQITVADGTLSATVILNRRPAGSSQPDPVPDGYVIGIRVPSPDGTRMAGAQVQWGDKIGQVDEDTETAWFIQRPLIPGTSIPVSAGLFDAYNSVAGVNSSSEPFLGQWTYHLDGTNAIIGSGPGGTTFILPCTVHGTFACFPWIWGSYDPNGSPPVTDAESLDLLRHPLTHQLLVTYIESGAVKARRYTDDETDTVAQTVTVDAGPACHRPKWQCLQDGIIRLLYQKGSGYYLAHSRDIGRTWTVTTLSFTGDLATYEWLTALEGRTVPVVMLYTTSTKQWKVSVGQLNTDNTTYTWSTPVSIGVTARKELGRLQQRPDGVIEFLFKDDATNMPKIIRCKNLGIDGTGTWS